jgi:hypothetical protein
MGLLPAGCSPKLPPIVPVSGTVYLDGQPLPLAQVEFVPELKHFGAESNSSAITDEQGHFSLVCVYEQKPGAVVATHRVVVTEHIPEDMRGMNAQAQQRLSQHLAALKNRPIPDQYSTVSRTPATVEVKQNQDTYDIYLTRK